MRRLVVGTMLLGGLLGLAGCGDDADRTATDPASDPAGSSSPTVSPSAADFTVVQVLSQTGGRGVISPTAVPVPDVESARRYATDAGLQSGLTEQLVGAVDAAQVPDGQALYAAVVALGCFAADPAAVAVAPAADGFSITADVGQSPDVECFAPVTSVALVSIAT